MESVTCKIAIVIAHVEGSEPDNLIFSIPVDPDAAISERHPPRDILSGQPTDIRFGERPTTNLPELRGIVIDEDRRETENGTIGHSRLDQRIKGADVAPIRPSEVQMHVRLLDYRSPVNDWIL
jgi:hypothetical protein